VTAPEAPAPQARAAQAPDLATPVAGFRAWRVANGRLVSPYVPCRWEGRVMHAACFDANRGLEGGRGWLDVPHESPHPACRCGIYAYHRPGPRTYFGEVWWCHGVVTAWGRMEVHADGLRAEFARVEGLAEPEVPDLRLRAAVRAIAVDLGVPLVAAAELPGLAARVGGPVPARLLPGR
jgi:hypothetical protein